MTTATKPTTEPAVTRMGKVRCESCNDSGMVRRYEPQPIGRASDGSPVYSTHPVRRLYRCPCGQGWGRA